MPFSPDMRRKIDQIRDYLYGGGYPDPLTNAEQLSFLFFFYMIEGLDSANLRQSRATGRPYDSLFAGDWTLRNPRNAPEKDIETVSRERMRWSSWANAMSGEQLVNWVRDEVSSSSARSATPTAWASWGRRASRSTSRPY
jgi:type I restriction enzyme M protein